MRRQSGDYLFSEYSVHDVIQHQERKLSEEIDPRYDRAKTIANYYVYGIQGQKDPNSSTGWWLGQIVEQGNDWECYAGLESAVMGDVSLLPPYVARFYEELFNAPLR